MKTKMTMTIFEVMNARDVEITGVIILSDEKFQELFEDKQLPEQYIDRLNRYSQAITAPRSLMISAYKALLVLGENSETGVAICGKDGVSYAAIFPGAREWMDRRIARLAEITSHLCGAAERNLVSVPLQIIHEVSGELVTADNGIGELLMQALESRPEITGITMTEDGFEIEYSPVPMAPDKRVLTLRDLIRCGLEEVHLCCDGEDHELATVVELNDDTLTEQGKSDWADVLDAKVECIYEGSYGAQIALSGVDAERLSDFSYMLAGYVPLSLYKRWVNTGGQTLEKEQSPGMTMQ